MCDRLVSSFLELFKFIRVTWFLKEDEKMIAILKKNSKLSEEEQGHRDRILNKTAKRFKR